MQHPYIKYEQDKTWTVVNDLINDLINNNDIELQTPIMLQIGSCQNKKNNKRGHKTPSHRSNK